jgi:hypothetical protein
LYASVAKSEAFSEATVRDLAADAFAAIFQDNVQDSEALVTKADAALAHLRTLLEATPLDWDVYIPVEGLAPSGLPLRVGQVNFFLGAQTALAEIDRTVLVLLDKNDHLSVEERQRQAESVSQSITKHFSERPLGRVTVRAVDAVAARSKGEKDYSPYNRLH